MDSTVRKKIRAARQKTYYHENKSVIAERMKLARPRLAVRDRAKRERLLAEDPLLFKAQQMLNSAKGRAKKHSLDFDLTLDWVAYEIKRAHNLYDFDLTSRRTPVDMSPSLDRFNNGLGYTKENVKVIPYWMNSCKAHFTLAQVQQVLDYMRGPLD